MSLTFIVVFIAAFVVLCACTVLVFHKDYASGFVGSIGLALIAVSATARLVILLENGISPVRIPNIGVVLWIGLALFLGRLLWKFLNRARTRGPSWYEEISAKRRKEG